MVGEERVGVLVRHVVGQVVAGGTHQDREEGQSDDHGVEDVVGANRQPLPFRLEDVSPVRVDLDDRDRRCRGRRAWSFSARDLVAHHTFFAHDLVAHHNGAEMPWARMKRKWTYISRVISAGRRNT